MSDLIEKGLYKSMNPLENQAKALSDYMCLSTIHAAIKENNIEIYNRGIDIFNELITQEKGINKDQLDFELEEKKRIQDGYNDSIFELSDFLLWSSYFESLAKIRDQIASS